MIKHLMSRSAGIPHPAATVAFTAALGLLPACGGSDEAATPSEMQLSASAPPALEGARVAGRDEALRIVGRGVVAPLRYSELAHAVLVRIFQLRSIAGGAALRAISGESWVVALDAQPLGTAAFADG